MNRLKAMVATGHGINCENETKYALQLAGFGEVDLVHLNNLANGDADPKKYNLIVFPGGFLDGDDLGSAQACVNRIRNSRIDGIRLIDKILEFINQEGLVLGICNGFQLLVKLGMLPGFELNYDNRVLSLTGNDSGRFEDRWVMLTTDDSSPCVFTKGVKRMFLPVRHGEGKIIGSDDVIGRLLTEHQAVLRYTDRDCSGPSMNYPDNPNGSNSAIAGICDPTGRIFGLMPHPECFIRRIQHPRWTREELPEDGDGLAIFKNAKAYLSEC